MALDIPHADTPLPTARSAAARIEEALAFDDVLLVPGYSQVLPSATDTRTRLTSGINLNIPLISAATDTVTESDMAIAISAVVHETLADWLR